MDTLMALQNLAVTVKGFKESVNLQATRVTAISSENIHRASKYHSTFGQLLYKYSVFADEYKLELANLHQALLTEISLKQKEREEQEREFQEKLELLSNKSSHSNLEIAENVAANSVNMTPTNVSLSSLYSAPNSEHSQNTESINIPIDAIPSKPQPMKSKKSIPISQKKQAPASNNRNRNKNKNKKKNNTKKSNGKDNKNQKNATIMNKTSANRASKQLNVRNVNDKSEQKNDEQDKYVYDADRVGFNLRFDVYDKESKEWLTFDNKEYKHSTMVYIGNIPLNIKVGAVQYFVMKKFKVTMRQIEETKVQKASSGFNQYALVRFRSDVPLDHITKYMDILNCENAKIKEEKVAARDAMNVITKKKSSKKDKDGKGDNTKKNKKQGKTSWQYRVFANYSKPEYHYTYYENAEAMYYDESRRHELFIRNFDILNKKCHKELTDTLLQFGDLYKDIEIRVDVFGDPYCIAVFKYINDAVYCCNSDIYFGGKRLDIRYSRN